MRPGSSTDPRWVTRVHRHVAADWTGDTVKVRIWVLVDEYADDGSVEGELIGTRQLRPNGEWSVWHEPPWSGDEFYPTQILDIELPASVVAPVPGGLAPSVWTSTAPPGSTITVGTTGTSTSASTLTPAALESAREALEKASKESGRTMIMSKAQEDFIRELVEREKWWPTKPTHKGKFDGETFGSYRWDANAKKWLKGR